MQAFSLENTRDYIEHRLKVAGCGHEIFTPTAVTLIYKYSSGSPRLINTICDNALLEGYLVKNTVIGDEIIRTVAVDLGLDD
jgi:type II secretory pathway predicted ATPase ExeA